MNIKEYLGIKQIIDMHCHTITHQDPAKNKNITGFMSKRLINNWQIKLCKKLLGIKSNDPEIAGEEYVEKMIESIDASSLDHVVVLALDGAYDRHGILDLNNTVWHVSNDFIFDLAKRSPKILPGCSINPLRRDWRDELDKCLEQGAVLIKWLPSVMGFSPDGIGVMYELDKINKNIMDFYKAIHKTNLPILSHAGFEFTLPEIEKLYAFFGFLQVPLAGGIKVIFPHFAGGRPFYDSEENFQNVLMMLERYPDNIWFDCSGMNSIVRKHRFSKAVKNKEIMARTIYGTDYPVPSEGFTFLPELKEKDIWTLFREFFLRQTAEKKEKDLWELFCDTKNFFDKDVLIKYAMGLRSEHFGRGYEVIDFKQR